MCRESELEDDTFAFIVCIYESVENLAALRDLLIPRRVLQCDPINILAIPVTDDRAKEEEEEEEEDEGDGSDDESTQFAARYIVTIFLYHWNGAGVVSARDKRALYRYHLSQCQYN